MRIPQNEPDISIRTGSTGPQAQPDDFGGNMQGLAHGMTILSGGLERMAVSSMEVAERQKQRDENRWLSESYEQERATLNEWMSRPENHSKESFATDFSNYATQRIKEYDKVAPSADARDAFRNNMGAFVGRKYEEALQTAEKTKVQNSVLSVDDQTTNALMGYRNAQGVPGADSARDLTESFGRIRLGIHSQFYENAPVLAGKLQDKLTTDMVLATAADDPKLARSFLDKSPDLDEHTRQTLIKHIEQQEKVVDLAGRDAFDRFRQDRITQIEYGKSRDKIGLELYQQFYPRDHAIVQKNRDDALIDTVIKSSDTIQRLSPMEATHQYAELSKLQAGVNSKEDADVLKYVSQAVQQNVQLQEKNRVAWLQQYNPEVKSLAERAATVPESLRAQAITERNGAVLKYQGPAPADADPDQRVLYLDRPVNDRHLMTLDEAEQSAIQINRASAPQAIDNIRKVLQGYPDPAHQYIAFSDMVTLPSEGKRLKQEYQLAFQNKDAWWIDSYVGAIANAGDLSKLTEERRKDLQTALDKETLWKNFQSAMIGDNFSRSREVEGYKNGIMMYANSLMLNGRPVKKAVESAANMLIGETLGFTSVNGSPLAVLKERADQLPHRTDDEVEDIGRRLGMALRDIDPREINLKNFSAVAKMPDGVAKMQALRDQITHNGFFQTSNDGQGAVLYTRDDNGNIFQVSDKLNQAFMLQFDELPNYFDTSVLGGTYQKRQYPSKTYDLLETSGNFLGLGNLFGTKSSKTNWPTTLPMIRRSQRIQAPNNQLE